MGYVKSSLIPGERILRWGRIHWYIIVRRLFWLAVAVALGAAAIVFRDWLAHHAVTLATKGRGTTDENLWYTTLGIVGIGGLFIASRLLGFAMWVLDIRTREYAITSQRIIMKRGFIRRITFEVMLRELESISIHQGIRGRLLGFGSIVISGTGGSSAPWSGIAAPMAFKKAAETAKVQAMGTAMGMAPAGPPIQPAPPPVDEGPGVFDVLGVNRQTGQDSTMRIEAGSPANAKVKAELAGLVVTAVRRVAGP